MLLDNGVQFFKKPPNTMLMTLIEQIKKRFPLGLIGLLLLMASTSFSQSAEITITGIVRSDSSVLEGVTVSLKSNPSKATSTSATGAYAITVPANGTLVFSFVGYTKQEVAIKGESKINVVLQSSQESSLDDVAVVAFGQKQKKASMVSSITTVSPKELKGPTSNLTTMLAGRISGMIAYQRSGEPGSDNAQFFIRGLGSFGAGKVDPLILIDGMESSSTNLARLQPDDIEAFSVLKDATAAAVYGARGANGVVLVTTKSGKDGKTNFNARVENSMSTNTQNFNFSDNITYMNLANEAALTRDPLALLPYSQTKIERTAAGDDPYLYPNNNWIKQLIKDQTMNQRYNLNVSGGAKNAQYYVAGTYNVDNGVLNVDQRNNFNSNIKLRNYSIRSNVNLRFTKTTEAIIRVYGQFDDYSGPVGGYDGNGNRINGGTAVFNAALWSNPVMFPAVYPSSYQPYAQHPLFGNAVIPGTTSLYVNPYARMVSGYSEYNTSTIQAQLELRQDLNSIMKGLNARVMAYTQRYAYFDVSRQYNPYFYSASTIDGKDIFLKALNDGSTGSIGTVGTEYLNYVEGPKTLNTTFYLEAALNYARTFNKDHAVSGMLITTMRNYLNGNAGSLQSSLPQRNQGVSGRFTYGYDNRYMAEFNFGMNGSEKFAKNNRFGFFPSAGLGWNVANESFFEPILPVISKFKLRATYGLVGNDQIGNSNDRFFYLSEVNMSNTNLNTTFGQDFGYTRPGVSISRYSNDKISWEKSTQINLGADITLFRGLNFIVDAYKQKRTNILLARSFIPTTMGLQAGVSANVGEAESRGIDASMDYSKSFGRDLWIQGRANFTFAKSKILVYDEPTYGDNEQYRYRVGNSIAQAYGYIAERLFVDEKEVANSPAQGFGEYMGGDIKYRDMNGDGVINSSDMVPLGYPTSPEIVFGFGFSAGYKSFDMSAFFQGSARSSFWINPQNISPFVLNGGSQNGLLQSVADDHWSEDNRNAYAFWPRLSDRFIDNNNQTSTWWMRDGSFLRLKTVEVGYNLPRRLLNRYKLSSTRIYINATNLFSISAFKMWDPEMGGNGLGYPVQKVVNVGLNLSL
jgi:TonB-linked SusC/RagA family outer membrane protein